MGVFSDDVKIYTKIESVGHDIQKKFRKVAKEKADEIADKLIIELGLDEICHDIDEVINMHRGYIDWEVNELTESPFDNYLVAFFEPTTQETPIDQAVIGQNICEYLCEERRFDKFVDKTIEEFAEEIWRTEIIENLRSILEEKCEEIEE